MKTTIQGRVLSLAMIGTAFGQSDEGLKLFISVDMEGVAGVVSVDDASRNGKDYDYFSFCPNDILAGYRHRRTEHENR